MSTQPTAKTEPPGQQSRTTPDGDKQPQEVIDRDQEQVKTDQEESGGYFPTAGS